MASARMLRGGMGRGKGGMSGGITVGGSGASGYGGGAWLGGLEERYPGGARCWGASSLAARVQGLQYELLLVSVASRDPPS